MHTRAVDGHGRPIENYGSGTFVVDWDMAQTLPDHDNAVGVATFTYSRVSPAAVTTIDVDFKGIKDDAPSTELYNALYRYTATPGAGGELKYAAKRDYYPDPHPSNSALEDFTIHSRWQETGTGRTDYELPAATSRRRRPSWRRSRCRNAGTSRSSDLPESVVRSAR